MDFKQRVRSIVEVLRSNPKLVLEEPVYKLAHTALMQAADSSASWALCVLNDNLVAALDASGACGSDGVTDRGTALAKKLWSWLVSHRGIMNADTLYVQGFLARRMACRLHLLPAARRRAALNEVEIHFKTEMNQRLSMARQRAAPGADPRADVEGDVATLRAAYNYCFILMHHEQLDASSPKVALASRLLPVWLQRSAGLLGKEHAITRDFSGLLSRCMCMCEQHGSAAGKRACTPTSAVAHLPPKKRLRLSPPTSKTPTPERDISPTASA